jgi:hypothetical protein
MKKAIVIAAIFNFVGLTYEPLLAKCVPLIKEAREQLAAANLSRADAIKVKALLEEADKLSADNNHKEGIQKANEALSIIKKK